MSESDFVLWNLLLSCAEIEVNWNMAYDRGNLMFDDDDDSFYGTPKTSNPIGDDDNKSTSNSDVTERRPTSDSVQRETASTIQSSEELNQINSALTHCTQLRTELRGTLLYIQRLNSKYAHTDYMAVVRNFDNYRRQLAPSVSAGSPYPRIRSHSRYTNENRDAGNSSNGNIDMAISSTPKKRTTKLFRRRCHGGADSSGRRHNNQPDDINNETFALTPKRTKFSQLAAAFGFQSGDGIGGDSDVDGTPKRSVREMSSKSNTISVCKIKVQRNIEAIITHLQVMQKQQIKRHQQQCEQSLYQSCCAGNLSTFGSPALSRSSSPALSPYSTPFASRQPQHPAHLRRMQQSMASSCDTTANDSCDTGKRNNSLIISSNKLFTPSPSAKLHNHSNKSSLQFDEGKRTLERVERCYVTPLQRMHKRLIHLNASLVRTC